MISFIFSLIPFCMICYYFLYLRTSGGIKDYVSNLGNKKRGQNCYECSTDLNSHIDYTDLNKCDPKLCLSCDRDRAVKSLVSPLRSRIYKFDKLFFIKDFEKYQFVILITSISLIVLNVILSFFDIKITSIPANFLLGIYWFFMIYRVRIANSGYKKSSQ